VLVVHRPRYDDWSLPKGKCKPGEDDLACALREVREETGLECEAGEELPSSEYSDERGRRKIVRYWAMRPLRGAFEPDDEVDEARWATRADAGGLLTYDRDRSVLDALRW
jgi:8-oxo-dGTP diphosphatase